MKIYLSGPMTGLPLNNVPAFMMAAHDLRARGHEVLNPAELPDCGFKTWEQFLERDIAAMCAFRPDAVALLPGWQNSDGANFELYVGRRLQKRIILYPDLSPI